MLPDRSYFFDNGIRFHCHQCGHCCTGDPGMVHVDSAAMCAIADHLGLRNDECIRQFALPIEGGFRLRELPDGRCIFYDSGCRIYAVRPSQCRSWPFWLSTLRSPERWHKTTRKCPGIGSGPRVSRDRIIEMVTDAMAGPHLDG